MKKLLFFVPAVAAMAMASCGNKNANANAEATETDSVAEQPAYTLLDKEQVDLSQFPQDAEGYYVIFNGKDFTGWRGYGKDTVPGRWTVDEGAIKFNGAGGGEAQTGDGGDLIFAKKLDNFEMEVEWKVSKGGNSGIFYLGQEVETTNEDGTKQLQPIYISAPEYQVLDNANHPDAKLGVDGNRQSASLYDLIPAAPQNSKPFGEWNTARVVVNNGKVTHYQNGEKVLEYEMWTPEWVEMLQNSKFNEKDLPAAFRLLNDKHPGFFAFQDHGDEVWFKNVRVKTL